MTSTHVRSRDEIVKRSWVAPVALVVATLIVFAAHFRPWEVAYLEEWPLASDWTGNGGWAFAPNYLEWTLSRPLHLLPSLLGLSITGGAPGGIFLILGIVAAAQVPVVVWALRPVSRSFWLSGAVALFLALHPLWPGGYLQRFLPAQTAALALAVGLGLLVRWFLTGRARWMVWTCVTLLLGFAVYPGPAAVAPLMALVVGLAMKTSWKRRIIAVVAVIGTSALMTLYSLVITRLISPNGTSYELGNIEVAGVKSVHELVTFVQSTLFDRGELILVAILCVAILGAVLALTGAIPHPAGWLLTGAALVSPASTVVFFGHTGWLSDIDRLGYVISLALFVALCVWPLTSVAVGTVLQKVIALMLVVVTLIGGYAGVQRWQPDIHLQHQLLDALGPVMDEADGDEVVFVVDKSATYGQNGTFPLQYLGAAALVWNDDQTKVVLCFEEPATLPSGAVYCNTQGATDLRLASTLTLPTGAVDLFIGRQESP